MSRLMVFTENYGVRAGGASYIVDLVNGVSALYDDLVLASNPRGYAPDTSARVTAPHVMRTVRIRTADSLGVDLGSARWLPRRDWFAHRARARALARDPQVFAHNVRVCRRAIRRSRPTAVLAFNGGYPAGRSVLAMVVAAQAEGVPVALGVVSVPGPRSEGDLAAWETRMDAMIGEAALAIIVNARAIGEALVEVRGLPADKVQVVHNALPDTTAVRAARHADDRVRIGCVARMEEPKGIRFLVQAFAALAGDYPKAELVLVGEGPDRPHIERLVVERGLSDRVTLTGHYDGDINEMVATFDIYAFPSLWEGLPYAILEAMRLGRPIVSTDVGGVAEAIDNEAAGLLVRPGSADELEAAIRTLLDDPDLRVRMGAAARDRFLSAFSLEAMQGRARTVFLETGLASRVTE